MKIGSNLLISNEKPEVFIPKLLLELKGDEAHEDENLNSSVICYQTEVTPEEKSVDEKVKSQVKAVLPDA